MHTQVRIPLLVLVLLCVLLRPSTGASAGEIKLPPKTHTILTEATPRDIPLRELRLREAGLKAAVHFQEADEIRVFKDRTVMNESPLARIWINAAQSNEYWFHTGGRGSADDFAIRAGHAVVIVTRGSTNAVSVPKP